MKKLLFLLLICLPSIVNSQNDNYKIYDVKNGKIISSQELVQQMKAVDVLFFGEEHNDSIGHFLEAAIFKQLFQAYPKTSLSLEMFHTDVQVILNEYLSSNVSEKNFIKESRAWNNYKDYKPLIDFAKAEHIDVTAANAATRYSNLVTKSGLQGLQSLAKASKVYLPPFPIDTADGRYYAKFIETMGGHNMGGMKIYQTQNLWDATMSWSIARYLKKHRGAKVFQINGRFHSDEHLGTYAKLQKQLPKLKMKNISCFYADDFKNPNWGKYSNLGDYVIITNPEVKRSY